MFALRPFLGAVALAGLPAFPLTANAAALPANASDGVPTPVLNWQPCTSQAQQGFDCATAQVPLDYSQPYGRTITLALIRHRATGPGSRLGSIFVNFGGPAAQGVVVLPGTFAANPLVYFPEPLRERFDIISWDPRGVGASTAVHCFPTLQDELNFLATLPQGVPATPKQQRDWINGHRTIIKKCAKSDTAYLLPHVSTTDTARDLDLLRRAVGDKQLNYQGNSYGTFLGAVYANLFPDRVGALVLLGNINAPAWVTADQHDPRPDTFLNTFLRQESDKGMADTLNAFLTLCGQATTAGCAFSAGSPAATQQKWNTLLQNVLAHPVTLAGVTWDYDAVVTTVAQRIQTVPAWAPMAETLEQVWKGNANAGPASSATAAVAAEPETIPQIDTQKDAVECAESPNPRHPEDYFALADLAYDRSGAVGPFYSWIDVVCAGWPAVAADRYTGPWDKPTAHPLLLVNTTYDPATPYSSAAIMANTFANARLLTVDGYGHVLGQKPSSCANNYIAAYFIDGTLPPPDTVCQQDQAPFSTGSGS